MLIVIFLSSLVAIDYGLNNNECEITHFQNSLPDLPSFGTDIGDGIPLIDGLIDFIFGTAQAVGYSTSFVWSALTLVFNLIIMNFSWMSNPVWLLVKIPVWAGMIYAIIKALPFTG